jgi:hypothetical protein
MISQAKKQHTNSKNVKMTEVQKLSYDELEIER